MAYRENESSSGGDAAKVETPRLRTSSGSAEKCWSSRLSSAVTTAPFTLLGFLVAPTRMEGALDDGVRWPATVEFASPEADLGRLLEGAVPAERPVDLSVPLAEGAVFAGIGYWRLRRSLRRR